jgi:hypothetical protein
MDALTIAIVLLVLALVVLLVASRRRPAKAAAGAATSAAADDGPPDHAEPVDGEPHDTAPPTVATERPAAAHLSAVDPLEVDEHASEAAPAAREVQKGAAPWAAPTESRAAPRAAEPAAATAQTCPTCGKPMIERVAKRGPKEGRTFLACSAYPECRTAFEL